MAEDDQSEIAALKARLAALETGTEPKPPPRKKGFGLGGFAAIALLIGAVALMTQGESDTTQPVETVSAPAWSPPEGFTAIDTDGGKSLGVKWSTPERSECSTGRSCFAIDVVPAQDCNRSLYVSITLLDETGSNIGWTNDTAQGVQAGENVRLVFTTYEENAEQARIAETSCY